MNRIVILVAGAAGASILAYTASTYAGVDRIAFALTGVLAVAFSAGLVELYRSTRRVERMHADLARLRTLDADGALEGADPELGALLRSRLEGSARPVPQPLFTPFLVGLLVMLGLLGTFLGLFETLRGAHAALSESQDVEALRAGLTSPMRGLMRSFGTSAAGVSTSALLGLVAVFVRRRAHAFADALTAAVTGPLAGRSSARRQLDSIEALAAQGSALPAAATALAEAAERLGGLEGTLEGSLKGAAEAFAARAERAMSEAVAEATEAVRRGADAAREGAERERERLEEWSRRFDEAARELAAAAAAQAEALARIEQGAAERATESAARAEAKNDEAIARVEARFERMQAAFASRVEALSESVGARLAAIAEAQAAVVESIGAAPAEAASRVAAALSESAGGLLSRFDALDAAQRERFESSLGGLEAAFARQLERVEALLSRIDALDAAQRERVEALLGRQADGEETQRERAEALLSRMSELDESQRARAESILEGLAAEGEGRRGELERLLARLGELDLAQRERAEALVGRISESDAAQRAHAEALLAKLAEADETHAGRTDALARGLATLLEEQAHALAKDLDKQARHFAEGIERGQGMLTEAATSMTVAGAELAALAESFDASVERHASGARAWLESLGELEAAVIHAGEGAAAEALESHLAHTQELFDRQLRFQRELFAELRALRGGAGAEESDAAQ